THPIHIRSLFVLFRLLAVFYNALPVRWQRRILDRTQSRFLVGVVGLGVDPKGHVILARHRFGAPEWRFLGGFLSPRERLEDALAREVREETGIEIEVGPILEANQGYRWQRIELVYAYRPLGGTERLSEELVEVRAFDPADLPDVRADQRGIIERRAGVAVEWASSRRR
ncbi:MAG TPA: NUDIX domain-containing protein, partial [Candidatus Limnocylindria bacterium]